MEEFRQWDEVDGPGEVVTRKYLEDLPSQLKMVDISTNVDLQLSLIPRD